LEIFESYKAGERSLLVSVHFSRKESLNASLDELKSLVSAADLTCISYIEVPRKYPDPKYFVGFGKLEEIKQIIEANEIDLVIFNHAISPSQERNIEEILGCKIIARTRLILEIFSQRAQTHEGTLQVELARLNYASTRLVRGWTHLERQKGGIGVRGGPGETQLELDRRMVRDRITLVESRLEKVRKQRSLGRNSRKRSNIPSVAIVGYTNAGKSTLFNKLTGANVLVKDQLFATLDPTLRRLDVPKLGEVILSDTVGFIRNLPHALVNAFCSTLEEAIEADLLLHVIDCADPDHQDYMKQVDIVLDQIGAGNKATINVFNKIDLINGALPRLTYSDDQRTPESVHLSVIANEGLDLLKEAIAQFFHRIWVNGTIRLEVKYGKIRSELYRLEVVNDEEIADNGDFILGINIAQSDLERICHDNALDLNAVFRRQYT
jgi:GTPase